MKVEQSFLIDESPEPVYLTGDGTVSQRIALKAASSQSSERRVFQKDPQEDLVRGVLPVLDGFERLLELADTSAVQENKTLANWLKAIESLKKRFVRSLERVGLEVLETEQQPLDLEIHEVTEVEEHEHLPTGTILKEIEKGYSFGGKVLRSSKVKVVKNGNADTRQ